MTLDEIRMLVATTDNALYTLYNSRHELIVMDADYESLCNCICMSECKIKKAYPLEVRISDHAVVDWLIELI